MIRLRELRKERGWSMRDASKFLNKSYTTYVNHEKEYREPNAEDLVAYAQAYDVSVDYLVGRTDIKKPALNLNDEGWAEDSAMEILDIIDDLTNENIEILKEYALFLRQRQGSQDSHK